jgi:hypothetical protein
MDGGPSRGDGLDERGKPISLAHFPKSWLHKLSKPIEKPPSGLLVPAKEMSQRRPYGTPEFIW